MYKTEIIPVNIYDKYRKNQPITILKHYNKLKEIHKGYSYGYMFSAASVYSSMLEGNPIDIDTYLKYKETGMNNNTKPFIEIENLKNAYEFAKNKKLNFKNFLEAHKILSNNLTIEPKYKGQIRDKDVFIYSGSVKIYTGASKKIVYNEVNKLFNDISKLKRMQLNTNELFYFASMIHLLISKIHPFADGNGRIARLCEKWFIADKFNNRAWYIMSEKLYKQRIKSYYKNLNIGHDYKNTDFSKSIPFLKMLPMALKIK